MKEIEIHTDSAPADYHSAQKIADEIAEKELDEFMLLSWYDKDRDFESPQDSSDVLMRC